jgi:integrase
MKAQVSVGVVGLRQFGYHSGNTISDERHWKNALSWSASRQTTRIARFESLIGYPREGEFVAPKTVTSARRIDLTDALIAELREWRLACPIGADDLIFPNLDGKPLCHSNLLQRGFYPALRRAGLRQIRFHDLRHTFASLLLANGEDVVRVSRLLGHSSPKITLDVYSHPLPTAHYGTAERLERVLNGNNLETGTPIATATAETR